MKYRKYGQLKKLLDEYGFKLEYIQTSGNLDMLEFINPNIEGVIYVDFDYDYELPEDIVNGREFSYDEDWVLDVPVNSIDFDIDVSIAYLSDDVMDTYGSENMNKITLFKKDLNLTEQVFKIISDPLGMINFQETYCNKQIEFYNGIKMFLPIIKKYNFTPQPQKRSGDENTLYPSQSLCFLYKGNSMSVIDFSMKVLTWEKEITIAVQQGFLCDTGCLSFDVSLEVFEAELERQIVEYDNFYANYKDYKDN